MNQVGLITSKYPNYFVQTNYQTSSIGRVYDAASVAKTKEITQDVFTKKTSKEIKLEKLNLLFPYGELTRVYNQINKDFGIDVPAKLSFVESNSEKVGGGYNFAKNEINMNLSDLIDSDTKIVGIKNGKITTLVSEKEGLPLFVDKASAENFVKEQSKNGNMGFDKLVAMPITPFEHKKFIIQKIVHEIIHSQQHMIMRNSDKIGAQELMKAWDKYTPENFLNKVMYNIKAYIDYKNSVWNKVEKSPSQNTEEKLLDSVAQDWLNAVKNYTGVGTLEYENNDLETDANARARNYINNKYGSWN